MGFFDRLLGRGDKFHKSGWSSVMDSRCAATTTSFLEHVRAALEMTDGEIVALNDQKQELRGTLLGYRMHVSIRNTGSIGDIALRYAALQGPYIDLEYDPNMKVDPTDTKPFDPSDRKIALGPQVFVEGSSADEEAATFKKLPQDLQARVVADMRRLRIRYFRSRREELEISMHDDPGDEEGPSDPVHWMVDALKLAADVTKARGALPVGQGHIFTSAERMPPPAKDVKALARALANEVAKQVIGAKVVERTDDKCVDVRWTEGAVPVRIAIDHDFDQLEVEALARGAKGSFSLIYDPEITREAKMGAVPDPWDEDRFEFFARSVFISGKEAEVRAEAAVLHALNPSVLGELVCLCEKRHATIDLDDEKLEVCLCEATQVTDLGAEAVSVARLLARVANALSR